ncbi:MAG: hypothetical protein HY576_01470 [candidate division NC10 bacterium]|nr:hypothetical protein [candidate division NC10 bacterium]
MRMLQATVASLVLVAAATEADALNLRVREVRRSREAGVVTITYEVENASVDAVRLGRAELQLTDPLGRRLDILPILVPTHPLERGEAAFLSARTQERHLGQAALLTLRLYPLPPFPFPVREVRVPPVEARFAGPAAQRGRSPVAGPERTVPLRPGPWRLRLAGSVLAPTGDAVLLLYALAGPGGAPETPAILEVRYSGAGALLEARSLPVSPARDGEAYLEVLLPLAVARLVDGIEARLFAAAGEGIAVHPVSVEGHRQAEGGARAGMRLPVRPPQDPRRVLDPAPLGSPQPRLLC